MTTGRDCIQGVRELLHDTGYGYSTDDRLYDVDQVLRCLNEAKETVAKMLLRAPQPAFASLNRMSAIIVGTSPQAKPPDFLDLIGANASDKSFIPVILPTKAPMVAVGHNYIYALGNSIVGPYASYGYWKRPIEVISDSVAPLTEFSDGIYLVIQLKAARELLPQEKADAVDRWKQITKMLTEELQTFG